MNVRNIALLRSEMELYTKYACDLYGWICLRLEVIVLHFFQMSDRSRTKQVARSRLDFNHMVCR